jgi:hypothetical protein
VPKQKKADPNAWKITVPDRSRAVAETIRDLLREQADDLNSAARQIEQALATAKPDHSKRGGGAR